MNLKKSDIAKLESFYDQLVEELICEYPKLHRNISPKSLWHELQYEDTSLRSKNQRRKFRNQLPFQTARRKMGYRLRLLSYEEALNYPFYGLCSYSDKRITLSIPCEVVYLHELFHAVDRRLAKYSKSTECREVSADMGSYLLWRMNNHRSKTTVAYDIVRHLSAYSTFAAENDHVNTVYKLPPTMGNRSVSKKESRNWFSHPDFIRLLCNKQKKKVIQTVAYLYHLEGKDITQPS